MTDKTAGITQLLETKHQHPAFKWIKRAEECLHDICNTEFKELPGSQRSALSAKFLSNDFYSRPHFKFIIEPLNWWHDSAAFGSHRRSATRKNCYRAAFNIFMMPFFFTKLKKGSTWNHIWVTGNETTFREIYSWHTITSHRGTAHTHTQTRTHTHNNFSPFAALVYRCKRVNKHCNFTI